tara:strand:- start:991 stop:1140 length:150 start_codon:yes stop_codon:yes gene_type:complete
MTPEDLMFDIQTIRHYVGRCIDGDDEMDLHILWEWLDTIVGEAWKVEEE